MPPSIFAGLSERGQELCRSLVGGDDIGPEGSEGVRWGELREGLSVMTEHAMTDEAVQWARSHLGSSQSQFFPAARL